MNLFEAGIIPSIPFGAIIGWVICKPFGLLAAIAGMAGGAIAGLFLGWLYGFVIILLMASFTIPWKYIRKKAEPMRISDKEHEILTKCSALGIFIGILCSGIIGLFCNWILGLVLLFISAVITSFISVVYAQIKIR
ncbi:hypothetical protein SMSP2_01109 [Limihaloglobus sulfuriphilus]|uniref:Uncharacterized protein n=1 Tax=Limihaloglobus sulfuriphilus TaxID=1851148 RepID=A0A1Q2MDY8_9BACT|nr:hypothetical protein [Limihaloglobus sulfuriphilus]AQQ70748.1 hypothetical protein SMSP2_01109 [Limihaloglobus sulfuriphilus]